MPLFPFARHRSRARLTHILQEEPCGIGAVQSVAEVSSGWVTVELRIGGLVCIARPNIGSSAGPSLRLLKLLRTEISKLLFGVPKRCDGRLEGYFLHRSSLPRAGREALS
eukprot:TRINITY_DN11360_c0_g1_i1.p2 TRINITY_DN11360_c0_g1~~TRINITY_DN11360_c0_g1_i1.p2  ORF type:complete len:110 (-),score=18.16 TRINITY_DN11360_c0_g1_i1:35-364(-)